MEKRITLQAGPHERVNCPVCRELTAPVEAVRLVETDSGRGIPAQLDGTRAHWIVDKLGAGETREYTLSDEPGEAGAGMTVDQQDGRMDVLLDDALLASYHHAADRVRPFINPLIGPTGVSVLRELFEEPDKDKGHDHIHHRGILVAHGDVNGTDNWSESKQHGRQRHVKTESTAGGPVFARIAVENDWVSNADEHLLREQRAMIFWNVTDGTRIVDVQVRFLADTRDVTFGDTKEGGILSVRVPTVLRADRAGRMANVYGGIGEKECWGKRAHWCDYHGELEGEQVGVAVFDHTSNFRHPTYWHIRNYGLFAANPFGLSHYYRDKSRDGSHTIRKGETFEFRYRVYVHKGDTTAGRVAEAYHDYINPPQFREDAT